MSAARSVRIFLSSTFRDFSEERDLLVKQVFPALRARLKDRFVELVDVDLRWGITAEQAERGEVLPICLAEIDRARPYFIGMLGERYGWIPQVEGFAPDLLERQPWLRQYQGGKSVTELEILHGVLNHRRMRGRAFFYFRSPAYARAKGGEYLPASREDRARQTDLKRAIRSRGLPVVGYATPAALARRIESDLWRLLDAEFPATDIPDAFERERLRHEAYAAPRRRLYLGGERYQASLQRLLEAEEPRIVITGSSGAGKSALLANFFEDWRHRHRKQFVHEHYLGASAEAADPYALVRRLIEGLRRATGNSDAIADDPQALMDSLPIWLATASGWARKRKTRIIIVLDALNNLSAQPDLRWWPAFLPQGISVVVSCLPGPVFEALQGKVEASSGQHKPARWATLTVRDLTRTQSATLLRTYLARFNKHLPEAMVRQVRAHPLATNPLFVRTVAEELRLFGQHERLQHRLDHYLRSPTIDTLFERVLQRVERDCGSTAVRLALVAIWASRAGLAEKELLGVTQLVPATWASIRHALDEALLENNGRLTFAHDYVRMAVTDRYLPTERQRRKAHAHLADWFRNNADIGRRADEEPWQWSKAADWRNLRACLTTEAVAAHLLSRDDAIELLAYWRELRLVFKSSVASIYRSAWKHWDSASDWGEVSHLAFRLCDFLIRAGESGAFATNLARLALDIDRASGSDAHAPALALAGTLCLEQGKLKDARKYLQEAYELRLRTPSNLAELARARYNFAKLLLAEENFEEGRALIHAALSEARQAMSHSADLLPFLHACAKRDEEDGNLESAWSLTREALMLEKRLYGPDDVRSADSLSNIGWLFLRQGRMEEAIGAIQTCIELRSKVLGRHHPDLSIPMANLALALMQAGRNDDAEPVARESAALAASHHGEESDELAGRLSVLGTILQRKGQLDDAETIFRRAVDLAYTRARALGRACSRTLATSLSNLGFFYFETGDIGSSLKPMRQALEMQEALSGIGSYDWAVPAFNLGTALQHFEAHHDEGQKLKAMAAPVLGL